MIKQDYKINAHNSTVCGYPGRDFDWSKFCWDGSEVYIDDCGHAGHPKEETKCPLPFVDDCLIGENCQYLHVPFAWSEQSTIYRVRPNYSMYAGEVYRGHKIIKQTAIKKDDGWYWHLEFEG